ncbi:MAG: cell division protein FtsZ, partial [Chloroflexota bacterium]
ANIIFGAVIDPRLDGEIMITVIATGFGEQRVPKPIRLPSRNTEGSPFERPLPQAADALRPAANDSRPSPSRRLPESDNIDIPTFLRRRG